MSDGSSKRIPLFSSDKSVPYVWYTGKTFQVIFCFFKEKNCKNISGNLMYHLNSVTIKVPSIFGIEWWTSMDMGNYARYEQLQYSILRIAKDTSSINCVSITDTSTRVIKSKDNTLEITCMYLP